MRTLFLAGILAGTVLMMASCGGPGRDSTGFSVPVEYYKLPNGLRVVLSQDATAPTVTVAVYYNIGFRIEPSCDQDRF